MEMGLHNHEYVEFLGDNPALVKFITNTNGKFAGEAMITTGSNASDLIKKGFCTREATFTFNKNEGVYKVVWENDED